MVGLDVAGWVGGVDVEGVEVGADAFHWGEVLGEGSEFSGLFWLAMGVWGI